MNAIAAWFDADFGNGIELDTSPSAEKTHWGRTVFPMHEPIAVEKGTEIAIEITCEPSGQGTCHHLWSVKVGDGEWEYHDTRKAIW